MVYKGIKIYDKVTIVEKTTVVEGGYNWHGRTVNQGYVVDSGNTKMLETALKWAKWVWSDQELTNQYWEIRNKFGSSSQEAIEALDKCQAAKKEMLGIVHEYTNGQFEIALDEAAGSSSQGGKLSFWNCVITAPDGNSFLIGINSELLLHLMMTTTLVNGKCQEKVWLGRIGGTQVGVFTEDMEDFKQAKLDEQQRQAVKSSSSKYNAGDIIKTLTEKELYLGSVYQYYKIMRPDWPYQGKTKIIIYEKPQLVHVFRHYYQNWKTESETLSDSYRIKDTKPKRIVDSHIELDYTANDFINEYLNRKVAEYLQKQASDDPYYKNSRYSWDYAQSLMQYGTSPKSDPEKIKEFLKAEYLKHCGKVYSDIEAEYEFVILK